MFKRIFDILLSLTSILLISYLLFIIYILATLDTKANGVFCQRRIGQNAEPFTIFKFRTINAASGKITFFAKLLRKYKLDEFPQLFNVLKGDMSFVGPRPDIAGYYDLLKGENRKILELKPGITSLASLKYADEERLLKTKDNPMEYNDKIIFPDKVRMNLNYYYKRNFYLDIKIIYLTVEKGLYSLIK